MGVGELVAAAVEAGARTVVVGLGGSGTTDGGAGLLAALGATADRPLDARPRRPDRHHHRRPHAPAASGSAGVTLLAASDVDNALTGMFGAAKTFGPQKGLTEDRIPVVDGWLEEYAVRARPPYLPAAGRRGGRRPRVRAAGPRRGPPPGFDLVAEATDLAARARAADLVLTGEGAFDFSSRAGKVPYGVAQVAAAAVRPCVALAGASWSARGRCAPSASSRRTPWSTSWGRSGHWASPPRRSPTWPSGWPGPGRAVAVRVLRNNRTCGTIGTL